MVKPGGIFIGLGSNLGDRAGHIRRALEELCEAGDVRVVACSRLHETEPVGGPPDAPRFLNAVAELATGLSPRQLLDRMLQIEQRHGRDRSAQTFSRTLDLDLLLYGDQVIQQPDLRVPHPRMWQRGFVMHPLAEICDLSRLPVAGQLPALPWPEREAPAGLHPAAVDKGHSRNRRT